MPLIYECRNLPECAAEEIEKTFVVNTYEAIASHFNSTRYKPWPKVSEFVAAATQNPGRVLVDVGFGNGKYVPSAQRSVLYLGFELANAMIAEAQRNLCHKTLLAFSSGCRAQPDFARAAVPALPLRACSADALVCIAVLHHLASRERRILALRELLRVLKVGGAALVYVWPEI
uniref:Alkylated DNA repair protein alkB homolog 8-like n=1 Tax=Dermatophagoides pteronyssinus TaxID=6956 RepID=A0A6P6YKN1_DERPT|nr:alkylated DNA repair protein alkB homolog 8-like [Dermatophagoides pteronyssinus]